MARVLAGYLATLKAWPLGVMLVDIAWGVFVTSVAASEGFHAVAAIEQRVSAVLTTAGS